MKKQILAFAMAAVMLLGNAGNVMAAGTTVGFQKNYTLEGANGAETPAETFNFEDATLVKVANTKYNDADNMSAEKDVTGIVDIPTEIKTLKITGPAYDAGALHKGTTGSDVLELKKDIFFASADSTVTDADDVQAEKYNDAGVGTYIYSFKETAGNTAGVTYDANTYYVYVNIVNADSGTGYEVGSVYVKKENKVDEITNKYQSGNLVVKKEVTGNQGDKKKEFEVNVTFKKEAAKEVKSTIKIAANDGTAQNKTSILPADWAAGDTVTVTLKVKNGTSVTLSNIPAGVTYAVTESTYADYTTTYKKGAENYTAGTETTVAAQAEDTITITNNKQADIGTGVIVSNLPYILVLGAAVVCFLMFFAGKKRLVKED